MTPETSNKVLFGYKNLQPVYVDKHQLALLGQATMRKIVYGV